MPTVIRIRDLNGNANTYVLKDDNDFSLLWKVEQHIEPVIEYLELERDIYIPLNVFTTEELEGLIRRIQEVNNEIGRIKARLNELHEEWMRLYKEAYHTEEEQEPEELPVIIRWVKNPEAERELKEVEKESVVLDKRVDELEREKKRIVREALERKGVVFRVVWEEKYMNDILEIKIEIAYDGEKSYFYRTHDYYYYYKGKYGLLGALLV